MYRCARATFVAGATIFNKKENHHGSAHPLGSPDTPVATRCGVDSHLVFLIDRSSVQFDGPYKLWAAGDFIYLDIIFEARGAWSGFLSFEGRADHRARVRTQITILDDVFSRSY